MRLHSRETFCFPGNTNIFTERHEFVYTDAQGDRLFDIYNTYVRHLERGRRRAAGDVREADLLRQQAIQARTALMLIEHRRIYDEKREEYHRAEQAGVADHVVRELLRYLRGAHVFALQGLVARQLADIARIEPDTPRVNVRRILKNALLVAAQMNEELE
ncbi:hypothetical protein V7S43_010036 [Phytophthora oleae]|uniref:Uncharacterized protein n=1 Tax=Phytophthora oleae TaxID=2107226 RepID=A0ABD3FDR7_9STRA